MSNLQTTLTQVKPWVALHDLVLLNCELPDGSACELTDLEGRSFGAGILDRRDPQAAWRRFSWDPKAQFDLDYLVETMEANRRADEANRRADSKEVLERLTRLEMPAHGKYVIVSRRNGHDPDFHEEASTSFTSTDHPPSRSRQSRRALRLARARTNTNLESMDVAHATPPGPDLGA